MKGNVKLGWFISATELSRKWQKLQNMIFKTKQLYHIIKIKYILWNITAHSKLFLVAES